MRSIIQLVLQFAARSIGKSWVSSIAGYLGIAYASFAYMGSVIDGNTMPSVEPVIAALGAAGIMYEKKPKVEVSNEKPA